MGGTDANREIHPAQPAGWGGVGAPGVAALRRVSISHLAELFSFHLEDAADDAAFSADRGAVNGHGLRAGHEGDDGGDFLGRFKTPEERGRADIGEEPFLDFGLGQLATLSMKSAAPSEAVGPGRTELTVTPVPATDSARPRATATCAVLVMP
jgi:hypothetical protein